MKTLPILLLLFLLGQTSAPAQSFYRNRHKFHRPYMSTAMTGAVPIRHKNAPNLDQAEFTANTESVEDTRDHNQKALRKHNAQAMKEEKMAARDEARDKEKRFDAESSVIGSHLSANQDHSGVTNGR